MNKLSRADESRLLDAVEKISALADEGMEPTAAVVKVARDLRLNANFVKLASRAYNVGRQTEQFHAHTATLDKLAGFPLADAEAALLELYPNQDAEPILKISSEYDAAPKHRLTARGAEARQVKHASLSPPRFSVTPTARRDNERASEMALRKAAARTEETARWQAAAAKDQVAYRLRELADYFKLGSHDRLPLDEVRTNCRDRYGAAVDCLFDYVVSRNGASRYAKEASAPRAVDWDTGPYALVRTCIEAGKTAAGSQRAYMKAAHDAQANREAALMPLVRTLHSQWMQAAEPAPPHDPPTGLEKISLGLIGFTGAQTMSQVLKDMYSKSEAGKPTSELVEDMRLDLDDPAHEGELNKIRAQAMLHDFISNDEVIAGYNPDEVLHAYNELAAIAPRSSRQPAVMRTLLRKRLSQNGLEPFEVSEIAKLESVLGQRAASSTSDQSSGATA